ncbi:MAG TPA: hypothetical protein ENI23_17845 [bacterium]|nr:hypothetical protein [bacterium]
MPKKLSIDIVRKEFAAASFILLAAEYINNTQKLPFYCINGEHKHIISWGDFKSGRRCGKCAGKHITIEEVRREFEGVGFTLISDEYISCDIKLEFKCPLGHIHAVSLKDFRTGVRCGVCAGKYISKEEKVLSFTKEGYRVVNVAAWDRDKSTVICLKGHLWKVTRDNFVRQGRRCGVCAGRYISIEEVKEEFYSGGLELLSTTYVNNRTPLKFRCIGKSHVHYIALDNFRNGQRCGRCFDRVSSPEKDILKFLKVQFPLLKCTTSERGIIPPYELDIFFLKKNLAIEYCGLYWHSENGGRKNKNYHQNKMLRCHEKGIRLITIFEDEYLEDREGVLKRLFSILSNPQEPIFKATKEDIIFSDLRWDSISSESFYKKKGFKFFKDFGPQPSFFKVGFRKRFLTLEKLKAKNFDIIWDCGHRVYYKTKETMADGSTEEANLR